MPNSIIKRILILILILIPITSWAGQVSLLIIDGDSYLINKSVKNLKLQNHQVRFFTFDDIKKSDSNKNYINSSDLIIVDVMMQELSDYLLDRINLKNKKIYALRGGRDDKSLKEKGFIFDPKANEYFNNHSVANFQNLIRYAINQSIDSKLEYKSVKKNPSLRIHHPETQKLFINYSDYLSWYKKAGLFKEKGSWIGIPMFTSSQMEGQIEKANYLIRKLEKAGFNLLPVFGKDYGVLSKVFLSPEKKSRVNLILAFSLKFYNSLNAELDSALKELNVPILNAMHIYSETIREWRKNPIGIPPAEVLWNISTPEISGLIEPTALSGKTKIIDPETGKEMYLHLPIKENIKRLIPRLKGWTNLQKKANQNKKVAFFFYNHSPGKQNIGASYLNVFRSLELMLKRMKKEGYQFDKDKQLTEENIQKLILSYGRNVGSWAPGELDKMLQTKMIVELPVATYKSWFEKLPAEFKKNVIKQWGKPEDSKIMIKNGKFIIPAVRMGNLVMLAEPSRGLSDDPMKLYHDPTVYPHHQYIAAYLWIKYGFNADAMVHLGTHATYEWQPGKQAGLSPACPPEVLVTDLPNIYPYIVDDVGEGIQAKRRGRAVIIDHNIPPLKESGLYKEYAKLYDLISSYNNSLSVESKTSEVKKERIVKLTKELGIDKDLKITSFDDESIEEVEHYLLEIKGSNMPYGMHTFGASAEDKLIDEMAVLIHKNNSKTQFSQLKQALKQSGSREINNFIRALNGEYISAGEGNDPLRNPAAIPTGKNFFGFSPAKLPSPSAWELGKKAAQDIINERLKTENKYPEKVGIVLWATESIRNEGVNESTILYLMGLKPCWDASGRVLGTEVIPGKQLKRPRIDVLINPSGLYRDLFPNLLLFLDKAVQKASVQKDIENLIAKNNLKLKEKLIKSGMSKEKASKLSKLRIFGEKPGSYGNGVSEMAANSAFWEKDEDVAKVYENHSSFAFGQGEWGIRSKELLKENLKDVDTAVHSISSNLYGTLDNDDMFQYLGGLALAVKKNSGKSPKTMVTMQRQAGKVEVEDIKKTIGREMKSRYLNPKWIEGMKKENYAGAGEMAKFIEYLWGWQVTVPESVSKADWDQVYQVYVEDKYGMELKEFFSKNSPWAKQSLTARMLETARKNYWKADQKQLKKLAVDYATSVVNHGVACCDHTCNHPLLNQMVVNILSLPGVMSPEMVNEFKMAFEKAGGKNLDEQVKQRQELKKKLAKSLGKEAQQKREEQQKKAEQKESGKTKELEKVEGYKMEEVKSEEKETKMTSSGVQWTAGLIILLLMGLFLLGVKRSG